MGLVEDLTQLKKEKGEHLGYLDARPKLRKQMENLQENTVVHMESSWADHIKQNWDYIKTNKSLSRLEGIGRDKTSIIVGASPALKKNVDALKDIEGEHRDKFILFVVNSAAEFVLSRGIVPDYILSVDCDEEVWKRDVSKFNREDLTILCSPFCWPEIPKNWKGELLFIPMGCSDDKIQEETRIALGANQIVPGCGNAFNEAVFIAWNIMQCKNYMFVGSELSWPADGKYYVDEKHSNDEEDVNINKFLHPDIYGNAVITTAGHWVFKIWLEDLASKAPGVFINATEGGILGISLEDGQLPFIKQFYLKPAISYVKGIYEQSKDWRFIQAMKYNLAWMKGYDCMGIPNPSMIKSIAPKTILDVGCGAGATVGELEELGYDAYGVDISESAADKWNGVKNRCTLAFAHEIPAEDDYFDLAMTDVLEHIPLDHVAETIKEVARVSKKQMFNIEYEGARWLIDGRIEPHMTVQPAQWWKKELKRCGLRITSTSGTKTFITEKR